MTNTPLNDFASQCLADSHRWFPDTPGKGFAFEVEHYAFGIAGERGEVIEIVKKWHGGRSGYDLDDPVILGRIAEELCDLLMYIGDLAALLGLDLDGAMLLKRIKNDQRFRGES